MHINIISVWNVEILNELYEESGWLCLRCSNINPVFRSCHCYIEQTAFFSKRHTFIFVCDQLNNWIVFNLAREAELSLNHIGQNYIVVSKAFGAMRCHECDVCIWVLFAFDKTTGQLTETTRPVKLIHIIVIASN